MAASMVYFEPLKMTHCSTHILNSKKGVLAPFFRYTRGEGVDVNFTKAVEWWQRAAQKGDPSAQSNLGSMYKLGRGIEQDYVKAVSWWKKGAQQFDAGSQFNLGLMYHYGNGVDQDFNEAIKNYKCASDQGVDRARIMLAQVTSDAAAAKTAANVALSEAVVLEGNAATAKAISAIAVAGLTWIVAKVLIFRFYGGD
jgi:TPR repeat protein